MNLTIIVSLTDSSYLLSSVLSNKKWLHHVWTRRSQKNIILSSKIWNARLGFTTNKLQMSWDLEINNAGNKHILDLN